MLQPAKTDSAKPAVAWSYGPREYLETWYGEFETVGVPTFRDLRSAIDALAAIEQAAAARERTPVNRHPPDSMRMERTRSLIDSARKQGQPALTEPQTRELLADWGIEGPASIAAANENEALKAAHRIGFRVAVKGISSRVTHKHDAGLVAIDIRDPAEVRKVLRQMPAAEGFLIQEMILGGLETIVGFTRTERLGVVLMLGLGGSLVETVAEVVFCAPPLDEMEADRMIDESGVGRLLEVCRSGTVRDRPALRDVLLRLSQLAEANLAEANLCFDAIEINPLIVLDEGQGAWAVDALGVLGSRSGK